MTRLRVVALAALVVVVVAGVWVFWTQGGDVWLGHTFGIDNGSGPWYLFWSGMGANFGEATILVAIIGAYRRVNCHTPWCPRLARHDWVDADGVAHKLCHKHHPLTDSTTRPTVARIAEHEARKASTT